MVQHRVIRFQVDESPVFQELPVRVQEMGRGQPFFISSFLQLRVREGQPDLVYLILAKEGIDELNAGPDEGNIRDPFLLCLPGAGPDPCPLDVDADKIPRGKHACQSHAVLPLAAAKFERNGMAVPEMIPAPFSLKPEVLPENLLERGLEDVWEHLHLFKLADFALAH
jgi:hypothetical protein